MSSEIYQMLAKTFDGLEEVLKTELEEIGATDVEVVSRGVKFSGSKEIMYRANFCCRTALRILRIIGEFNVKSPNDLYQGVYKMEWENYFDVNQTFAINSTVNSEAFNNSMFVSLKSKDAIVDRFRSKFDKRPSVNTDNPDFRINVHASSDAVTISLDSSGESLHKRGYRVGQNEASMSEVLAAGILKLAGWKGQTDFYDTMCGSGTIPIEAALIARNIPPGIFRPEFAFETWKDFDKELLEKVYNDDYEVPFEHKIFASDISEISLKVAEKNAKSAGVLKSINFIVKDFAQFQPDSKEGLLIINPPYGERMNERKVEPIYNMIGTQLKHSFSGFKAWVFSSSDEGFKSIGLKPSQKIPLFNGPLECSFRLFEVYEGSKKESTQNEPGGRRSFGNDRPKREFPAGERKEGFKGGKRSEGFSSDRRRDDSSGPRSDRFSSDRKRPDSRPGEGRERFGSDRKREGFAGRPGREGDRPDRRRDDSRPGERRSFNPDRKREDSGFGKRDSFQTENRREFKPKERFEIQTSEPKPKRDIAPREAKEPRIERDKPARPRRPRI